MENATMTKSPTDPFSRVFHSLELNDTSNWVNVLRNVVIWEVIGRCVRLVYIFIPSLNRHWPTYQDHVLWLAAAKLITTALGGLGDVNVESKLEVRDKIGLTEKQGAISKQWWDTVRTPGEYSDI